MQYKINHAPPVVIDALPALRAAVEARLRLALPDDEWRDFRDNAAALGIAGYGPYDREDVRLATQWLRGRGVLQRSLVKRARAELKDRLGQPAVRARVQALRRELFGAGRAPFGGYASAEAWLQETSANEGGTRVSVWAEPVAGAGAPRRVASADAPPATRRLAAEGLYLAYRRPDGARGQVPVRLGGVLDQLRAEVTTLARDVGCPDEVILHHVLTGAPVFAPPLMVESASPLGSDPAQRQVTIRVRRPWVPAALVAQVYTAACRQLLLGRSWRGELQAFAAAHRGPASARLAEWNTRYPEHAFKNANSLNSALSQAGGPASAV